MVIEVLQGLSDNFLWSSRYIVLLEYCISSVRRLSVALLYLETYFIIFQCCCQTASLAGRPISFHTENRKWQDECKGLERHAWQLEDKIVTGEMWMQVFLHVHRPPREEASFKALAIMQIHTCGKLIQCNEVEVTLHWLSGHIENMGRSYSYISRKHIC